MAEDRATAGREQQGAEGVAGLGRGQDWGEAGGEEECLRSGDLRASAGDHQGQEEEKQDGEEGWHRPPSVRERLLSDDWVSGEFHYFQNSDGGEGEMQGFHTETDENHNNAR